MRTVSDLSGLDWVLKGWTPYMWQWVESRKQDETYDIQMMLPAKVPGSVQYSLREAGLLPDWNVGLNAQACEWVENRHWIYETVLPDLMVSKGKLHRLVCLGLDYSGWIRLNGKTVFEFRGTHVPHVFDLTPHLADGDNLLQIVFDLPPRWLGQMGYTSKMTEWKTRFNYTWDWMPRLVQIGIWDTIYLESTDGEEIEDFHCVADADMSDSTGLLKAGGKVSAGDDTSVRVTLSLEGSLVREETIPTPQFSTTGISWAGLPVDLWWPNLEGEQLLYTLKCTLLGRDGEELDSETRTVGFRHTEWISCEGAPEHADPWICVVNGRPIFLQGVNFPPMLPNFADTTDAEYRKRLELYKDLGLNILRINACGFLEKETFYNLCDELGLMVWQEFPLTSSGLDNIPPDNQKSIDEMAEIARSFVARRRHHASLIIWSGGNELIDADWRPLDVRHPMLSRLKQVVQEEDPTRRFIAASPSGPRFGADAEEFGKGLHWDVHGPWNPWEDLESWAKYFEADDALFRSELGSPAACSAEIILKYAGECSVMPVDPTNPLHRRPTATWMELKRYVTEIGHAPESLEDYVAWSQERQSKALSIAMKACKDRFPRCGGVILWCGHDCFPCTANTSIIDFHGNPKPAALALAKIWKETRHDH